MKMKNAKKLIALVLSVLMVMSLFVMTSTITASAAGESNVGLEVWKAGAVVNQAPANSRYVNQTDPEVQLYYGGTANMGSGGTEMEKVFAGTGLNNWSLYTTDTLGGTRNPNGRTRNFGDDLLQCTGANSVTRYFTVTFTGTGIGYIYPKRSGDSSSVSARITNNTTKTSEVVPVINTAYNATTDGPYMDISRINWEKRDLSYDEYTVTFYATSNTGYFSCDAFVIYNEYTKVTDIANVPTTKDFYTDLVLPTSVSPSDATAQTVNWTVKDAGTTGAKISGGKLITNYGGTTVLTATVPKGISSTEDFEKDYTIKVDLPDKLQLLDDKLANGFETAPAGAGASNSKWGVDTTLLSAISSKNSKPQNAPESFVSDSSGKYQPWRYNSSKSSGNANLWFSLTAHTGGGTQFVNDKRDLTNYKSFVLRYKGDTNFATNRYLAFYENSATQQLQNAAGAVKTVAQDQNGFKTYIMDLTVGAFSGSRTVVHALGMERASGSDPGVFDLYEAYLSTQSADEVVAEYTPTTSAKTEVKAVVGYSNNAVTVDTTMAASDYVITYTGRNGTTYNSTTAPTQTAYGDYTAALTLSTAGAEKYTLSTDSVTTVNFTIYKDTPVTDDQITAAIDNQNVTITIENDSTDNKEFQFWNYQKVKNDLSNEYTFAWVMQGEYSPAKTCTFSKDGARDDHGDFTMMVRYKHNGEFVKQFVITKSGREAGFVGLDSLTINDKVVNNSFMIEKGTAAKLKVNAFNCSEISVDGGSFETVTDEALKTKEYTLDTSKVGAKTIKVIVRDDKDTFVEKAFVLKVYSTSSADNSGLSEFGATPTITRTINADDNNKSITVDLSANGTGNTYNVSLSQYGIKFAGNKSSGIAGKLNSTSNVVVLNTKAKAYGKYLMQAKVKSANGFGFDDEISQYITFNRPGNNTFTCTPTKATGSTVATNSPIGFTSAMNFEANTDADPANDIEVQYAFARNDGTGVVVLRDFSSDATFAWNPSINGVYEIIAMAKGKDAASFEFTQKFIYTVGTSNLTGNLNVTATSISGSNLAISNDTVTVSSRVPVIFTSELAGSTQIVQYSMQSGTSDSRPFSPDNEFVFTPTRAGTYKLTFGVRENGTSGYATKKKVITVNVTK